MVPALLDALRTWAEARPDVHAVGVAGSYARGTARPDSDVDVVLLTADPEAYLRDWRWLSDFGVVRSCTREDWGAVQSLRTIYAGGLEVEFGVAALSWARRDPLDPGTRQVVRDGFFIVFERGRLLTDLLTAVSA